MIITPAQVYLIALLNGIALMYPLFYALTIVAFRTKEKPTNAHTQ
jgi:hypothetical protein